MSTTIAHEQESKQQTAYNGKDDQKQQAALSKKQTKQTETKQTEAPVDSGSSLVGGTIAAVQNAVDRGINMLPASLQDRAHTLEEQAKLDDGGCELASLVERESYQQDGIIAAAKTTVQVTKETATAAASQLQGKKDEKAELKGDKKELKDDLKAKKDETKSDLKSKKEEITKDLKAKKEELTPELKAKKEELTAKKDELTKDLKAKKDEVAKDLSAKKDEIKSELKGKKEEVKTELKGDKKDLKAKKQETKKAADGTIANLQKTATDAALGLQASAIQLKDQAIAAGLNLKERVLPAGGDASADAPAPKKHGRRRRGGRGHGNRKMKTRVLAEKEIESITDTLGDKAREIKAVIEEKTTAAGSSNGGIVNNIRANVSNLTTGITSTASGLASSASSTASGLVSGAQAKVQQLTGSAKQVLNETSKANNLERKPELQRRDELPALGTPMSPDATITETRDGKLAAKPADQSTLLDKAKFAVGGVVEATRDFVADKLDNLSMNADDDSNSKPLDKDNKSALKQASAQLDNLKSAVTKKEPAAAKKE